MVSKEPEIKGKADMTSLTGDTMTWDVTLVAITDFTAFKHC